MYKQIKTATLVFPKITFELYHLLNQETEILKFHFNNQPLDSGTIFKEDLCTHKEELTIYCWLLLTFINNRVM